MGTVTYYDLSLWNLARQHPLKSLFFQEINESKSQNASSVRTFPYLPMARWMPQKVLLFST
jgi:hypothetical protein